MTATTDFPAIVDPDTSASAIATKAQAPVATLEETARASFVPLRAAAETLIAKHTNIAHDLTTKSGLAAARKEYNSFLRQGRYAAQNLRDDLKTQANSLKTIFAEEADSIIALLAPTEKSLLDPITARDTEIAAEAKRLAEENRVRLEAIDAEIRLSLSVWLTRCQADGMTAERITAGIGQVKVMTLPEAWHERAAYAEAVRAETIEAMNLEHGNLLRAENAALLAQLEEAKQAAAAATAKAAKAEADAAAAAKAEADAKTAAAAAAAKAEADAKATAAAAAAKAEADAKTAAAAPTPLHRSVRSGIDSIRTAAPAAAPAATPAVAPVAPVAPAAAPAGAKPLMTLGEINAHIAPLQLTADGLSKLGFVVIATRGDDQLYMTRSLGLIVQSCIDLLGARR